MQEMFSEICHCIVAYHRYLGHIDFNLSLASVTYKLCNLENVNQFSEGPFIPS